MTTLNNQFGLASLDDFCDAVEAASPSISALGITDYCSLRGYEEVLALKEAGRLPNVQLIFPNVEVRFALGTVKGSAINGHLLFCPDDPDHVHQIRRFLSRLSFTFGNDQYYCQEEDLIRLGRKSDPKSVTTGAALKEGVNQFKVTFKELVDELNRNEWARKNCLVGVATAQGDGTSGLRTTDGSFRALRESIESAANLIFSGKSGDVDFWLGRGTDSESQIESKYGGLKPCIHGSDAHELSRIGRPDLDRFCWIKGTPTFESLRQACIEPVDRVRIAAEMPRGSLESHTIKAVSVTSAPWMKPNQIALNPGLVAIIGARGSGKTALADFIAAGGLGASTRISERSFISRAAEFLSQSKAELTWESGENTGNWLSYLGEGEADELPRVQYLSQHFVDALCSSEGITDSLVEEVRRVIFEAHDPVDREGTSGFEELYAVRCRHALEGRKRCEDDLVTVANELLQERSLKAELPELTKQRQNLQELVRKDVEDQKKLVTPGQEARTKRHQTVAAALQARRTALEALQKRQRDLRTLQEDLQSFGQRNAQAFVRDLQEKRKDAGLTQEQWLKMTPSIPVDADIMLQDLVKATEMEVSNISGPPVSAPQDSQKELPLIAGEVDLSTCTVNLLQAETDRLTSLIGIDKQNIQKYKGLGEKIAANLKKLAALDAKIERAGKAGGLEQELIRRRKAAYRGVFEAISMLQDELEILYSPLSASLECSRGALSRLRFVIRRKVDLSSWTSAGESLLDLRKAGQFQGKGRLRQLAADRLERVWSQGSPDEVSEAVNTFIVENADNLKAHRLESMDAKEWNARISSWLHATSHLSVEYGLQYEGVDVERLSPGTRGIVLLLLYLEVDKSDDRPLIIDQPEENLDPQSVYDELVPRFRSARNRRQIIIVTHNANLVVNTDVDQVIVASAGQHKPGNLPEISYLAGGLEENEIRQLVCRILEGGERAFEARAKRLRVTFAS